MAVRIQVRYIIYDCPISGKLVGKYDRVDGQEWMVLPNGTVKEIGKGLVLAATRRQYEEFAKSYRKPALRLVKQTRAGAQ